jgi:glycosyltransferase involved in cell wall biosynthesis
VDVLPRTRLAVDIVIPTFNEAGVVEESFGRLCAVLAPMSHTFAITYVNDGSTDTTASSLAALAERDPRVRVIELSRNFGHQAALTAGIDAATGDAVVTMDADGQHPPELIPQMLDLIAEGYDVVQGQRVGDMQMDGTKKLTSAAFYRLLNIISGTHVEPGAADFRAMSRQAVEALKSMPEYHRFLRGMISWIGFRAVILPYHESTRIAGESKYSMTKMLRLAMDAIFSFSLAPLYIGLSMGGLLLCLALLEMLYVLSFWVTGRTSGLAPGWSSLMFVVLIIGGMLMILLGFVGVYVGYIFQEVKRRPVYLVRKGKPNA